MRISEQCEQQDRGCSFRVFCGPPALLLAATLSLGCGNRAGRGAERFVPKPEAARSALETALEAWRRGEEPGPIASNSPVVHLVDSHRRPGQRLAAFEILGEVAGDVPRTFAIRLSFEAPSAEEKARFVVVGIDPLWVFREEDYAMMAHWEHPMGTEAEKPGREQEQKDE